MTTLRKLLACLQKEMLVLFRDPAGIGVLFIMPAALLVAITLVQDGAMKSMQSSRIKMLVVDEDGGKVARAIRRGLQDSGVVELVTNWNGQPLSWDQAQRLIGAGQCQAGLRLAKDLSPHCQNQADRYLAGLLAKGNKRATIATNDPFVASELVVSFDPAIFRTYQSIVTNALQRLAQGVETDLLLDTFGRALPAEIKARMQPVLQDDWSDDLLPDIAAGFADWKPGRFVTVAEKATPGATLPNSVQQNVPAWTLFGMFFIVIPISTSLLREKNEGTLTRLLTLPVSPAIIILGKVLTYAGVCMVQFGLMVLVGRFLLPALGTPVFELGTHGVALVCVAACAALAATGYGMMIGTLASTTDQANVFGAVSVVILAAIGGVMVPTYIMPPAMRLLSQVSPLGWGLSAFLDILVRGKSLAGVLGSVGLLLGFFGLTLAVALGRMFRRN